MADGFAAPADQLVTTFDGMGPQTRDMSKAMTEGGSALIDAAIAAITSLFLVTSVLGIVGTVLGSRTILGFANFFGVVVLIVMTIVIAIEMTISVAFADFCSLGDGPNHNLVALATETMGEGTEGAELFSYYATCTGENAAVKQLLEARDYANILGMQTKGLGGGPGGVGAMCNSDEMLKIWSPTTGVSQNVYIAVGTIASEMSCKTITPILVILTHDAICDKMVSGIYNLWASQACASFFLVLTLVYAAFVREHFRKSLCPIICGGETGQYGDAKKANKVAPRTGAPGEQQGQVIDRGEGGGTGDAAVVGAVVVVGTEKQQPGVAVDMPAADGAAEQLAADATTAVGPYHFVGAVEPVAGAVVAATDAPASDALAADAAAAADAPVSEKSLDW
jgi:hypothetical protein